LTSWNRFINNPFIEVYTDRWSSKLRGQSSTTSYTDANMRAHH